MSIWELARLSPADLQRLSNDIKMVINSHIVRRLSDDADLQRLFALTYCLHPQTSIVWKVLKDACKKAERLQRSQIKRPRGEYKLEIPDECFLQLGVYLASQDWEKDQEHSSPTRVPQYQPTSNDRVVRYLKLLILETMSRRSVYGAIGLGCFLFTYHPGDIEYLFEQFYSPHNLRRCKQWLLARIKARFGEAVERVREARGTERIRTRPLGASERPWIHDALVTLCPWYTPTHAHLDTSPGTASVLERYFGYEAKAEAETEPIKYEHSEWWRIHALIDPACAGFASLVRQYNQQPTSNRSGKLMKLNDPDEQCGLPLFYGNLPPIDKDDDGDRGPRFHPQPLTPQELKDLRSTLIEALRYDQQRLHAFQGEDFLVYVQGEVYRQLHASDRAPVAFSVPSTASFLEIYGRDADGELLLAVCPLPDFVLDDVPREHHLVVRHESGLTLELAFQPGQPDPEATCEVSLQVLHAAPQRQPVLQDVERPSIGTRLWEWLSAAWHPPLAGEVVTGAGTQAQEHVFALAEGEIRVTCDWWTPQPGHPGMLRITWQASIPRVTDVWARFTQLDDPAVLLAEARLGDSLEGDITYTAEVLGFDPTRDPWALAILLREPPQ